MVKTILLPYPTCLRLKLLDASDTAVAVVTTTFPNADCPFCQGHSEHIHSRYVRIKSPLFLTLLS